MIEHAKLMSGFGTPRHTALPSSYVRFGGEPEMSGRTACLISTPFCFALDLTVSDVVHPATVTLHRMDTWRAVLRPVDV
jgi:hypothetical protein